MTRREWYINNCKPTLIGGRKTIIKTINAEAEEAIAARYAAMRPALVLNA